MGKKEKWFREKKKCCCEEEERYVTGTKDVTRIKKNFMGKKEKIMERKIKKWARNITGNKENILQDRKKWYYQKEGQDATRQKKNMFQRKKVFYRRKGKILQKLRKRFYQKDVTRKKENVLRERR